MDTITVRSFAKINLSLDVGPEKNGYHAVDMIMQQLAFHDDVEITSKKNKAGKFSIHIDVSRPYLPRDYRNLAWQAAELMIRRYGMQAGGADIHINIRKRIPVAAGLAGGSGNAAAVLHGLNALWNLKLGLPEIMELSAELGSDVPFTACGEAASNRDLPEDVRKDPLAVTCCRATGRGTELKKVRGIHRPVVIARPRLGVSTREVYAGIDYCVIPERPDNDRLIRAMKKESGRMYRDFINVLENYTLFHYPEVGKLKKIMEEKNARKVLMSGSGPTVFAIYNRMEDAIKESSRLRGLGYESYWTRTDIAER